MKLIGMIVSAVSALCLLIALNMSTTITTESRNIGSIRVPSMTVNNIGLMQDKQNYIISSAVFLIIGVGLYLFALKHNDSENIEKKPLQSQYEYEKRNFVKYDNDRVPNEIKFKGDKELTNDAYKLYLVNKFKVTKNDVFNKFVYQDKLFESLDELLIILDNEENKKFQTSVNTESINTESYNEFVRIRTDCLTKITKNGTSVKTEGSYPNMKWSIINEHGSSIKQLKNLQELIDYAKLVK